MRDLSLLMNALMGGATLVYINLGLIAVLSGVAVLRPQQIIRLTSIHRAFLCVGTSIIMGPLSNIVLMSLSDGAQAFGRSSETPFFPLILTNLPGILTGVAVLFLCHAIVPKFIVPVENDTRPTAAGIVGRSPAESDTSPDLDALQKRISELTETVDQQKAEITRLEQQFGNRPESGQDGTP